MTSLKDQNQSRSKQIVGNDFFETRKTAKRQNRQQPRNRKKYNSENSGVQLRVNIFSTSSDRKIIVAALATTTASKRRMAAPWSSGNGRRLTT